MRPRRGILAYVGPPVVPLYLTDGPFGVPACRLCLFKRSLWASRAIFQAFVDKSSPIGGHDDVRFQELPHGIVFAQERVDGGGPIFYAPRPEELTHV